jgi:hypothetical protein
MYGQNAQQVIGKGMNQRHSQYCMAQLAGAPKKQCDVLFDHRQDRRPHQHWTEENQREIMTTKEERILGWLSGATATTTQTTSRRHQQQEHNHTGIRRGCSVVHASLLLHGPMAGTNCRLRPLEELVESLQKLRRGWAIVRILTAR